MTPFLSSSCPSFFPSRFYPPYLPLFSSFLRETSHKKQVLLLLSYRHLNTRIIAISKPPRHLSTYNKFASNVGFSWKLFIRPIRVLHAYIRIRQLQVPHFRQLPRYFRPSFSALLFFVTLVYEFWEVLLKGLYLEFVREGTKEDEYEPGTWEHWEPEIRSTRRQER